MKTYYDITVDLYDLYPLKKIEAQQNNIGRGARITLTAGGLVLGLDGESVTMWAKKPDGTVSYLSCSVVDGKIQADFTSQMLAVPGDVQVELRLVNGEENITTPIFSVHVRKSNIDDSAAESTNEFTALASMVAEVNEMKKTALKGDPGEAVTLEIGTVEASEPGSAPSVTNSGTAQEAILNFILPRGQTGPEGPAGQTQIHFSAAAEFPAAGNSTMLYVDNTVSPAIIYTWTGNAYVQASADISTVMAMLATPYDPDQDYTAGQYVTYNKQYWKFTATKSAGEWDASKAVATNVGTEISALNANKAEIYRHTHTVDAVANTPTAIPGTEGYQNVIPTIFGMSRTIAHQTTIMQDSGKWWVTSTVSQNYTILFWEIKSFIGMT